MAVPVIVRVSFKPLIPDSDTWDSLSETGSYKSPLTLDRAFLYVKRKSAKAFSDPIAACKHLKFAGQAGL